MPHVVYILCMYVCMYGLSILYLYIHLRLDNFKLTSGVGVFNNRPFLIIVFQLLEACIYIYHEYQSFE